MTTQTISSVASDVVEGGVSAAFVAYLQQTVLAMIPFALPALVLVALDLDFGLRAAKHRYQKYRREQDRVTFSRAVRGTVGKVFDYVCWLVVSSSMSVAFHQDWIQWAILGLVYVNELGSVIGNYLCTKDIEFSLLDFLKAVFVYIGRWFGNKLGITTDDLTFDDILKPAKQGRNAKGQFTKKPEKKSRKK
jgi:hypothetical protein